MLTKRHLALIRAALQFFDEEISPHGPEVAQPYFEDPLEEPLQAKEAGELRVLLRNVELRYLHSDRREMAALHQELMTPEQAKRVSPLGDHRLFTVLLTSAP